MGSNGPLFFALDLDSGLGTGLIYRSVSGNAWEALDSPVVDTTPIQGMAYDDTLDELYILWASRVDRVSAATTTSATNWLTAFTTLPAPDSGSKAGGITVI